MREPDEHPNQHGHDHSQDSPQPGQSPDAQARFAGASLEQLVETVLQAAMAAFVADHRAEVAEILAVLADRPDAREGRDLLARAISVRLPLAIRQAWTWGWEPTDLFHYTRRELGAGLARLLAQAVAEQLTQYPAVMVDPRWHAQLRAFGLKGSSRDPLVRAHLRGKRWAVAAAELIEVMTFLLTLPALGGGAGQLPGQYRPAPARPAHSGQDGLGSAHEAGGRQDTDPAATGWVVDERVLSRIRALLAKAEATTSPAEAEAFMAGAQERMARHSIDMAMVQAGVGDDRGPQGERPTTRRIWIDPPYEQVKTILLAAVATANRCRSVWTRNIGFCTVIGFEADLDAVELLFTSLLLQATAAMQRVGRIQGADRRTRSSSFRQSFLAAYALRIGERLTAITKEQTDAARAEIGDDRLLPVLAGRAQEVEDHVADLFPNLTQGLSLRIGDQVGWAGGRGAADLATLNPSAEVTPQ